MRKYLLNTLTLITIYMVTACSEPQEEAAQEATISVDPTMTYDAFEEATKTPDASITKDGDWTVVSRMEKGKRVYWFVAPDVDKISPALFKKSIQLDNNSKTTLTVSKCEAPKKTCDDLMKTFETMSEKYK